MHKAKKRKHGFTLIEVLAVITILAVVALIILPIVTNVIEKSRRNSFINSVYSGMRAVNDDLSNQDFKVFPSNGLLAKSELSTLEKNPFIDGKFKLQGREIYAFKVTDGRYCSTGTKTELETVLGPCYLLDKTAPIANLVAGSITSNSIQIIMNATDEESDIVSYEFSKDNGATWTNKQTTNNYTFTKLKNGTSFNFKARVTNENSLTTEKSITLKTLDIAVPTYTSNPSLTAWSKNKVVTIHYPTRQSNFIYEYSTNNCASWTVVPLGTTYNVTFTNNGNITARVRDGYNTVTASTLTITTVDTLSPTASLASTGVSNFTISVKATATGSHMGIKGYQYSRDNGASWTGLTTANTYTYTGLSRNTTYPLKVRVTAGNDKTADSSVINVKTLNNFNVTFNANGGSVSTGSKVVTGGSTYGTLPTPTRANYNFTGWYTAASGGTQITAGSTVNLSNDITLYAHWTLKQYTVTFNANGGSVSPTSKVVTYSGTYGTLPTPTRANYNFAGWYTAASGGTQITAGSTVGLTSNQTLYAHWTLKQYTVTFNANGGSVSPTSKVVTYSGTYGTLPTPTRANYVFLGWYTAASGGTKITAGSTVGLTNNQTLYAQWRLNTVVVTFNANGGTGGTTRNVTVGNAVGSLPATSRSSYTHQGWYTARGGGSKISSSTTVNSATTFYARWYHNAASNSSTNGNNFRLTLTMKQTGLNSVSLSASMANTTKSACGTGSVSYSCTGGKSGSQGYTYSFGVSGSCAYVYNGSWSVGLPSYSVSGLSGGSSITCTYTFNPNSNPYFGSAISTSVTYTLGN